MKKDWIMLDVNSYDSMLWSEESKLYWCGGESYSICWHREAFNQDDMNSIVF